MTDPAHDAPRAGRPWMPWAIGAAALAVALALAFVLIGHAGTKGSRVSPSSGGGGTTAPRVSFAFRSRTVGAIRVTKKTAVPDLSPAAAQIQRALARLYDQGVVDPAHWRKGPPASFWNAFAPDVRATAQADRTAFTIGSSGTSLLTLRISSSTLTIRFLIDDKGLAASALATATIAGNGTTSASGPVDVKIFARFLFEPVSGTWLITGYPTASVDVTSPGATRSPAPSAAPSVGPSS